MEEVLQLQAHVGNDRTRAKLLSNIGFAREELGQITQALDSMHQAVAIRETLGDQWGLSRSLGSIAAIHRKEGRFEQARQFYERAAGAAERADAREEESVILQGLAQVQSELGLHPEAFQSLRRHLELEQDLERAETSRRITELESKTLLETQERLVQQERFARNVAIAGGCVLLLVGILGWNLFRLKRRAHQKLESLHTRLGEHAADLEAARGRIRGLEELLPICSYCKSIRDERGAWHRLESYLHERAGARMTHGICPACVGRAAHDLN